MDAHRAGQLAVAAGLYQSVLSADPQNADALHLLGVLHLQQGRAEEAVGLIRRAASARPAATDILSNLAAALSASGKFQEALDAYSNIAARDPRNLGAQVARATLMQNLGRLPDALQAFDRIVTADPGHGVGWFGRGNVMAALGRFDDALASYERALAIMPRHPEILNNRGNVLSAQGELALALASYREALAVQPNYLDALNNCANTLKNLNEADESLAMYAKVLTLDPNNVNARFNRALFLIDRSRFEEALADLEKIRFDPAARDAIAWAHLRTCQWPGLDELFAQVRSDIHAGAPVTPFFLLGQGVDMADHLAAARNYVKRKVPATATPYTQWPNVPHGKIRVGYLSSDFRQHVVGWTIAELVERHDRDRFEIVGLSAGPDDSSPLRARLAAAFDQFHDVSGLNDRALAQRIHDLGIGIVVDLNNHTIGSRIPALAQRPAPVQATYLGSFATTGADFIDYIIADRTILPFEFESLLAEKIVQLPEGPFAYDTRTDLPQRMPTRLDEGLPENGVVFCCFNDTYKIRPEMFDVWMRILRAVPGSVLWLLEANGSAKNNLLREAEQRGIGATRLVFAKRVPRNEHLARQSLADLFLDTSPVNAGATACDAIWSGVPLLTCRGRNPASRVAASVVEAIGLPELATTSLQDYEALAARLAESPPDLAAIREKLRKNRTTHPLFDMRRFCMHIEKAYTMMWDNWRSGARAKSFAVEAIGPASGR